MHKFFMISKDIKLATCLLRKYIYEAKLSNLAMNTKDFRFYLAVDHSLHKIVFYNLHVLLYVVTVAFNKLCLYSLRLLTKKESEIFYNANNDVKQFIYLTSLNLLCKIATSLKVVKNYEVKLPGLNFQKQNFVNNVNCSDQVKIGEIFVLQSSFTRFY